MYIGNLSCNLCKKAEDNQQHLFQCETIKNELPELADTKIKYEQIYGTLKEKREVSKLLNTICKIREKILETEN